MAKKHAAAVAALIALVVPASALAGFPGSAFNDYEGKIERDPSTAFGFDISRVNGHRAAHEFDLTGVPFACFDGSVKRENALFDEVALRITHGSFSGELTDLNFPGYILTIDGELPSRDVARGTLKLRRLSADPPQHCYSGVLRWHASRNT